HLWTLHFLSSAVLQKLSKTGDAVTFARLTHSESFKRRINFLEGVLRNSDIVVGSRSQTGKKASCPFVCERLILTEPSCRCAWLRSTARRRVPLGHVRVEGHDSARENSAAELDRKIRSQGQEVAPNPPCIARWSVMLCCD